MNKTGIPILLIICMLTLLKCSNDTSSWKWPLPTSGFPPRIDQVGPRISLVSADGNSPDPGSYSGISFTSEISLSSSGDYTFTDCEFQQGFDTVIGGSTVTRNVTLDHCTCLIGLYFEDGGQKNWTISWCHLLGEYQALRPKGLVIYDNSTPTPFYVSDSIVEITCKGRPDAHCEAMQCLGGNSMIFTRVSFITPGPYENDVTGQTSSINHGGGDTLFDRCDFFEANAFHFTVYADGENVLLRNCRMARGLSGYIYWASSTMATYEGCTDIVSGEPIN